MRSLAHRLVTLFSEFSKKDKIEPYPSLQLVAPLHVMIFIGTIDTDQSVTNFKIKI